MVLAASVTDRRHRRREETIREIVEVAVELMGEHGAAGLSLGDVARRMGMRTPSLYDEAIQLLARNGLPISAERLAADCTLPTKADDSVKAAWLQVYGDTTRYWGLYELAEKLVDLETAFRFWRFRHVTTVERIIGFKTGTGGTAGVSYLRKMLDVVLFPELFALRTEL